MRDDVAYDTIGHCFFLEDGVETGNVFAANLTLQTRTARAGEAVLETDAASASYGIGNPSNTFIGNVAAGSDGNGFCYSLSPHPTGPSATADMWLGRTALGTFAANVAHSNAANGRAPHARLTASSAQLRFGRNKRASGSGVVATR